VRRVVAITTARQNAKIHVVALSSCRPVANDAHQMARCSAVCCRDVTLSLGTNRRIGYLHNINQATGRHRNNGAARCPTRRLACFASDRTTTLRLTRFAKRQIEKAITKSLSTTQGAKCTKSATIKKNIHVLSNR
jgi:hypothetical protein